MSSLFRFQFYFFALIAVGSALCFVTRKNPVAAALWLVNVMFALSGLYVMLDAPFVAAIQVLVYAGAIMVVFVFVVMLLNLGRADQIKDMRSVGVRVGAGVLSIGLAATVLMMLREKIPESDAASASENVVAPVAAALFNDYLIAFEATSLVLLVAVVGAVVLAKRRASA
ncbi:MAG: NADH-quinone oxidoreductase subunit J [Gemmatimonadota bacterium]|nr:NADH-quinone oxidoreductase subunit J [Gemmatimonadota bacterium]